MLAFCKLGGDKKFSRVALRVCGGILEFTASLRSRGQGCSVPALPCHHPGDEDEDGVDGVVNGEGLVGGGGTFQQKIPFC